MLKHKGIKSVRASLSRGGMKVYEVWGTELPGQAKGVLVSGTPAPFPHPFLVPYLNPGSSHLKGGYVLNDRHIDHAQGWSFL